MIVVYDFDKTLTFNDTVFGFFLSCSKKDRSIVFKIIFYFLLMVAHKIKIIDNRLLKKMGVELFLKGKKKDDILMYGQAYSKKIVLNSVYHQNFKNKIDKPYIVSGSFQEYLAPLFPNGNLICSEISYIHDRVKTISINCYGSTKRSLLEKRGISHINELYTDSLSDLPLAQMSDVIFLVKGDKIIRCDNVNQFKKLLKLSNTA